MLTSKMAEPALREAEPTETKVVRRDWAGAGVGIGVFIVGVVLLVLTFRMAQTMFAVPPEKAIEVPPGKVLDLEVSLRAFAWLIIKVLLLLVMAIVSAVVANRGIKLYTEAHSVRR